MLVLPCRDRFSIHYKELHQFLLAAQADCQQTNRPQIISISWEIDPVDPLVVWQQMAQPEQPSFYLENPGKTEAIAAIGAAAELQLAGQQRFEQAQEFVQLCLAKTSTFGNIDYPFAGPHFFCSFSFFDNINQPDYPFPAATVFLPRWQVACSGDHFTLVANCNLQPDLNIFFFFL